MNSAMRDYSLYGWTSWITPVRLGLTHPHFYESGDESIEDTSNLPAPGVIAEEILEDLRAALEELEEIAADFASDPV